MYTTVCTRVKVMFDTGQNLQSAEVIRGDVATPSIAAWGLVALSKSFELQSLLGLQVPPQKVFGPSKPTPSQRVLGAPGNFHSKLPHASPH